MDGQIWIEGTNASLSYMFYLNITFCFSAKVFCFIMQLQKCNATDANNIIMNNFKLILMTRFMRF